MHASAYLFFRERGKLALHEIYPRGVGGREVQMKAWLLAQPAVNARRLVGGVVVEEDEVDFEVRWNPSSRVSRNLQNSTARLAAMTATDDRPRLEIGTELAIPPQGSRVTGRNHPRRTPGQRFE